MGANAAVIRIADGGETFARRSTDIEWDRNNTTHNVVLIKMENVNHFARARR
jgi:hypothetical protein